MSHQIHKAKLKSELLTTSRKKTQFFSYCNIFTLDYNIIAKKTVFTFALLLVHFLV